MDRSKAFRLDGDLRPIWVVSGRIRNNSETAVKSVSIAVRIYSKPSLTLMDESILTIDIDIVPHAVGSFSRDVQLLPPNTPWGWGWDIVKAIPK